MMKRTETEIENARPKLPRWGIEGNSARYETRCGKWMERVRVSESISGYMVFPDPLEVPACTSDREERCVESIMYE